MMLVRALISGVYVGLGSLVVMYSMKPFITSTSLSPTLTYRHDKEVKYDYKDHTEYGTYSTYVI